MKQSIRRYNLTTLILVAFKALVSGRIPVQYFFRLKKNISHVMFLVNFAVNNNTITIYREQEVKVGQPHPYLIPYPTQSLAEIIRYLSS